MFHNKLVSAIALAIIFLLSISTAVLAAQPNHLFDISYTIDDPSQYQFKLLLKLVDCYNPSLNNEQKITVCTSILSEAKITGLDPFFISSIIAAESSFCPRAVSSCEALGLMQLTSCVSTAMHINNPFNIQENIYAGTRFLLYLKNKFGDNNLILAAYNAGPTRVARLGRVPNIKETLNYIKKINRLYTALRQELYSLIQNSTNKLFLCRMISPIINGNTPTKPILVKSLTTLLPIFPLDFYLCETKRSIRFVI